jgi:beta-phosphoglucomutase-like phosphatase (HAD superfamily)
VEPELGEKSLGLGHIPDGLMPPVGTRALLFDCDGTLVDTLALYRRCWDVVFGKRGFTITDEWFETWRGHSMEAFLTAALPQLDEQGLIDVENEGLELFFERSHELEAFDHVVDIARQFHGTMPIAVVSGGPRRAVERTLEGAGIAELFDLVVTNNDVSNGKPAPDVYLLAMERLGVSPEHCVAYEDSGSGIQSAMSAGIPYVFDVRID